MGCVLLTQLGNTTLEPSVYSKDPPANLGFEGAL